MNPIAKRSSRRRTMVAAALVLTVLGGFVVRLVDIQVVHAEEHVADSISTGNMAGSETLYGNRGTIVDANGVVLASTTMRYDVNIDPTVVTPAKRDGTIDPADAKLWEEQSAAIAQILGMDAEEVRRIVADKKKNEPESQWAQLKRNVSTAQFQALRELGVTYLTYDPRPARAYPNGAVAGNLLGFESSDGEALAGVERWQDQCLEAKNGEESYQIGATDGIRIPGSEKVTPAVDGGEVALTLDSDLQWYLQQMIAEETQNQKAISGTVTVAEVDTGAILAAAQYPSMDPNDVLATDPEFRGSLVFGTTFEPGSTFKAVTAASLLEEGVATPLSSVTAKDWEQFPNGARLGDSHPHPEQTYTLAGALIDSSNVALSKFGELLPDQTRYEWLKKFGIGAGPVVGFPGEENGWIESPDKWDNQQHYATTFGQAFTATIPQVVSAYQTIANDGVRVPLRLVESCTTADGEVKKPETGEPERVISESTAQQMQLMLENVGFQSSVADQIKVPGYSIASKTGTAQKPAAGGGYKPGVYFTSIVGFAPADDPQYVVMITLDEPKRVTSSAATAPALQKAMKYVLQSYRVVPGRSEPETKLPMLK
ncbi:penicillin-binding protein 2 [Microbacterium paludicola]|uniref:Penicillin-binding protein 2 n=1 Tax=Microbacterium paludicola TaxID=300019 RepID=A0A4Y9FZJ7_9MICO|nr:penicillin-binding protein 2 [Microbacterium paludicola]MBF0815304.1 penicillin-binding protein 2 [Microbacterium paludicola]TFU34164.1 penicillin-binding protein 2 [Microbacterium paludicola]